MASDTFVYWRTERPTHDEVLLCLEDYVRGIAVGVVRWDGQRFSVTFPGAPSFPFARVGPATDAQRAAERERAREREPDGTLRGRWFEVYTSDDYIDVITRQQDEITMNIAHGFAELCARAWNGELSR